MRIFQAILKPSSQQIRGQDALKNIANPYCSSPSRGGSPPAQDMMQSNCCQVSPCNAAAKVIFYVLCSQLFNSGHDYKLVDAASIAFAYALDVQPHLVGLHDETDRRDAPKPCAMNVSTRALSETPSDLARMVN